MTKMKKMIASAALATTMAASAIIPASAAGGYMTIRYTGSGNTAGITTNCSYFDSYVTAHARVTVNGAKTERQYRGYKWASVSASRYFVSGKLERYGWDTL